MIYVTGSNGLIGRYLSNKIDIVPITFRGIEPQVQFDSESVLIHLSSSISTRDDLSSIETSFRDDVSIPLKIFRQYLNSNPNGKIIFFCKKVIPYVRTSYHTVRHTRYTVCGHICMICGHILCIIIINK